MVVSQGQGTVYLYNISISTILFKILLYPWLKNTTGITDEERGHFFHLGPHVLCKIRQNNLPAVQETRVQSPGQQDPLEKETATHSNILAWRIPWTEEPGRLQSMGLQESDMT